MKTKTISRPILAILANGRCDGANYFLPPGTLDRKTYTQCNDVLAALGGKWNTKQKAHVFPEDCSEVIEGAVETESYTRPSDMGWFPTPEAVGKRVIGLAGIRAGDRVLEPSAGLGALARLARDGGGLVTCVEVDRKRAFVLLGEFADVQCRDFLLVEPSPQFDVVVMNPPFAKRADIHHVTHARKFLKRGGKLVSVMSGGIAFRADKLSEAFRAECSTIEALPEDSFKASGTAVNTVIITMLAS